MKENTETTKVTATTLKETAKAYQLSIAYWTSTRAANKTATLWVPKSMAVEHNGTVTEIASFILDKWITDHCAYIRSHYSSYAADKFNCCFDLASKENIIAEQKAKTIATTAQVKDATSVLVDYTKPFVKNALVRLGADCLFFGHEYKGKGVISDQLADELTALGLQLQAAYGDDDQVAPWLKDNTALLTDYVYTNFPTWQSNITSLATYLNGFVRSAKVYFSNIDTLEIRRTLTFTNGEQIPDSIFDSAFVELEKKYKSALSFISILDTLIDKICA